MDELQFLSLRDVAERLELNWQRALALHDAGVLNADAKVNHTLCFRADRIGELRKRVAEYGLARATKANTRRNSK